MGSKTGDTKRGSLFSKRFAFADFFFETVTKPSESDLKKKISMKLHLKILGS
jgi:hypothetical protein